MLLRYPAWRGSCQRLPARGEALHQFQLRQFSTQSPDQSASEIKSQGSDDGSKKVSYTFNQDEIKGNRRGQEGLLLMAFTCSKCETKQAKTFSKQSYTKGVILIRCDGCDSLHLIADNLGWFEDSSVNIQDIMREKGEQVTTNITDSGIEFEVKNPESSEPVIDGESTAQHTDEKSEGMLGLSSREADD